MPGGTIKIDRGEQKPSLVFLPEPLSRANARGAPPFEVLATTGERGKAPKSASELTAPGVVSWPTICLRFIYVFLPPVGFEAQLSLCVFLFLRPVGC